LGTTSKGDNMTNYSLDERERNESQKQREQRAHGLDERYSSKEGLEEMTKTILRTYYRTHLSLLNHVNSGMHKLRVMFL